MSLLGLGALLSGTAGSAFLVALVAGLVALLTTWLNTRVTREKTRLDDRNEFMKATLSEVAALRNASQAMNLSLTQLSDQLRQAQLQVATLNGQLTQTQSDLALASRERKVLQSEVHLLRHELSVLRQAHEHPATP